MATTALYRISSGEVIKISAAGQTFADRDATYWGVLTNPSLPDGSAVREALAGGVFGPFRQLGFAKIRVGTTVRNATQAEIDTFAAAETADDGAQDATEAASVINVHPRMRKVMKALVKRIIAENNQQSQMWNDFRAQVALSSSLADFKSRVAAMQDLPTRTLNQAITALLNDISASD